MILSTYLSAAAAPTCLPVDHELLDTRSNLQPLGKVGSACGAEELAPADARLCGQDPSDAVSADWGERVREARNKQISSTAATLDTVMALRGSVLGFQKMPSFAFARMWCNAPDRAG